MPKITYIEFNGVAHTVDVKVGSTVMLGARDNNLPGIDADCGGGCSCGTCHVYVDPAWLERLNKKTELEAATMEFSNSVMPNSRLACQIPVTDELDGLVVRMPESQR